LNKLQGDLDNSFALVHFVLLGKDVVFLGSLYDRTKFVEQLSMVMVLPRQFVDSLSIVFPYFGVILIDLNSCED